MSPRIAVAAPLALALVAVSLGGCVSLLPKTQPVQLYELNPPVSAPPAGPEAGARIGVRLAPLEFEAAGAGDRMLTLKGPEAAYIGGARWVTSAQGQFGVSLERAFAVQSKATRLVARGDGSPAELQLALDVDAFHVRYDGGAATVEVVVRARLVRYPSRGVVTEKTFSESRPVASNRVTAIVEAYDAATAAALADVVAMTDAAAPVR